MTSPENGIHLESLEITGHRIPQLVRYKQLKVTHEEHEDFAFIAVDLEYIEPTTELLYPDNNNMYITIT